MLASVYKCKNGLKCRVNFKKGWEEDTYIALFLFEILFEIRTNSLLTSKLERVVRRGSWERRVKKNLSFTIEFDGNRSLNVQVACFHDEEEYKKVFGKAADGARRCSKAFRGLVISITTLPGGGIPDENKAGGQKGSSVLGIQTSGKDVRVR